MYQITTSCAAQCKNLTNRALELLCLALEAHLARNVEQGVFRDVAVVRDVLHLVCSGALWRSCWTLFKCVLKNVRDAHIAS